MPGQAEEQTAKTVSGGSRRLKAGSGTGINIALAMVIFGMINYLALRHYARYDWTGSGMYTLSEKSTHVVGSLEKDVSVFVMWGASGALFSDIKELGQVRCSKLQVQG